MRNPSDNHRPATLEEEAVPALESATPIAHELCDAQHPSEAVTCELVKNPWPHDQHVGHADGEEPLEQRTFTWPATQIDWSEDATTFRWGRPEWMSGQQWAAAKDAVLDKVEALLREVRAERSAHEAVYASPKGGCSERTWCTMGPTAEHLEFHSGDAIGLAGLHKREEDGRAVGWWGWLSENREGDSFPKLTIEGKLPEPDGTLATYCSTLTAVDAWDLLQAARTKQSHARLLHLVTRAMGES